MLKTIRSVWTDEAGMIVSAELVLVMTISVLAMLVGLDTASDAINQELADVGEAFGAISQSFSFHGISHPGRLLGGDEHAFVSGSSNADHVDDCDCIPLDTCIGHVAGIPKCEDGFITGH